MVKTTEEPHLMLGMPTGYSKHYCMLQMAASIQALDVENMEVHVAVTDLGDEASEEYYEEVQQAFNITHLPNKIHRVKLTPREIRAQYVPILRNREALRGAFLDGDYDEFFLCGGDNPPRRDAVKRLRALDADIAFGVSYQRPKIDEKYGGGVYPLLWEPIWTMDDVYKHDLPHSLVQDFRKTFAHNNIQLHVPLIYPDWRERKVMENVVGGDGNCLIRRPVLEEFPWIMPKFSKISEDMLFMKTAMAHDYTVKCDITYHVAHIHHDWRAF